LTATLTGLLERSRQLGFLGPGPIEAHVPHALAFSRVTQPDPARALDLGAGGGLPGLVLAATVWPGTSWTFVDANVRRTDFLREAVAALGLVDRVDVVTERAEVMGHDPAHRGTYQLVVARSFASPAVAAECAAPLLQVGGRLLVSEPPDVELLDRWPVEPLAEIGFGTPTAHTVALSEGGSVHLAMLQLVSVPPTRLPRRVGVPAKRPLF
jgi:16S rRNA (guanine527-N7)-methyltransferase